MNPNLTDPNCYPTIARSMSRPEAEEFLQPLGANRVRFLDALPALHQWAWPANGVARPAQMHHVTATLEYKERDLPFSADLPLSILAKLREELNKHPTHGNMYIPYEAMPSFGRFVSDGDTSKITVLVSYYTTPHDCLEDHGLFMMTATPPAGIPV